MHSLEDVRVSEEDISMTAPAVSQAPADPFAGILKANKDPIEVLAQNISNDLFSKDKLLMTSRMSKDYALMIIRNIIISKFFIGYYGECKASIELIETKEPPFYRKKVFEYMPDKKKSFQSIMENLNTNLMEITIAFDGEGRKELVIILQSVMGYISKAMQMIGIGGEKR